MGFVAIKPAPPLDALVADLWDCEMPLAPPSFERILPSPRPALIINLLEDETRVYEDDAGKHCQRSPGSVFSGPYTRSFVIDTAEQSRVMGVHFHAAGAFPLFNERIDRLAGRDVGLEDLLGSNARRLRERLLHTPSPSARLALLERWLAARLASVGRRVEVNPLVSHAVATLARAPAQVRISELARASQTSLRRFGALFREQVGLTPKRFARAVRFRAVIASVHRQERVDWAALAVDCGFHDQPHLIREFRDFAGLTPAAYLARQGQHANHVPLD